MCAGAWPCVLMRVRRCAAVCSGWLRAVVRAGRARSTDRDGAALRGGWAPAADVAHPAGDVTLDGQRRRAAARRRRGGGDDVRRRASQQRRGVARRPALHGTGAWRRQRRRRRLRRPADADGHHAGPHHRVMTAAAACVVRASRRRRRHDERSTAESARAPKTDSWVSGFDGDVCRSMTDTFKSVPWLWSTVFENVTL